MHGHAFHNQNKLFSIFSRILSARKTLVREKTIFSHFVDFSIESDETSTIYIFSIARFTHKLLFSVFSVNEENSRMKNIFQMSGLVFVCIYTTRDAFLLSFVKKKRKILKIEEKKQKLYEVKRAK